MLASGSQSWWKLCLVQLTFNFIIYRNSSFQEPDQTQTGPSYDVFDPTLFKACLIGAFQGQIGLFTLSPFLTLYRHKFFYLDAQSILFLMADVSGHQFNRKSFDLMTESPPCNFKNINWIFLIWSNNFSTEIKEGGGELSKFGIFRPYQLLPVG